MTPSELRALAEEAIEQHERYTAAGGDVRSDRECQLARALLALLPFVSHPIRYNCWDTPMGHCDCGLDAALDAIGEEKP